MARKIELKIRESPPEPLKVTLKSLVEERGLSKKAVVDMLKDVISQTLKDVWGDGDYVVDFDEEKEEFRAFARKLIVKDVKDPKREISIEEIKKIDPSAEVGDEALEEIDLKNLGRRGAQRAKTLLELKLSGAIEESIYEEFSTKKGKLLTGMVKKIEYDRIRKSKVVYVDLGRNATGVLPPEEMLPQDLRLREGDSIKAVIKDVRKYEGKFVRTEIILSRADVKFVEEIIRKNVSEIEQGIVKIKSIARKPGVRTKILVYSDDPNIDPVGTCVGVRGIRIRNIVQELGGERLDVVPWTQDLQRLITNALGIQKVSAMMLRKREGDEREAIVVVPDDELSVAIGRGGVNVRLASELIGIKINVRSESEREKFREMLPEFFKNLGIGEKQAQIMWDSGFRTIEDIAMAPFEKIREVPGITEAEARRIWQEARRIYFEKLKEEEKIKGVEKSKLLQAGDGKKQEEETEQDISPEDTKEQ